MSDDNFVEANWRCLQLDVSRVVVLTCRYISEQVLDQSVHLTNSNEDTLSEFVLIVHFEPTVKHRYDLRLQHLTDGQFVERLLR